MTCDRGIVIGKSDHEPGDKVRLAGIIIMTVIIITTDGGHTDAGRYLHTGYHIYSNNLRRNQKITSYLINSGGQKIEFANY